MCFVLFQQQVLATMVNPNINITKKYTSERLKRANKTTSQDGAIVGGVAAAAATSKAHIVQQEMARARAKSLRTYKGPASYYNRGQSALRQGNYGLAGTAAVDPSTMSVNHHNDDDTLHYNAEILTTMSSLTEPTFMVTPSMSMDITSTVGSLNPYNHASTPTSNQMRKPQRKQLKTHQQTEQTREGTDAYHSMSESRDPPPTTSVEQQVTRRGTTRESTQAPKE